MQSLHPSRRHGALSNHQADAEQLRELGAIAVGLLRQIARVHPDHRNGVTLRQLTEHVQQHRRLDAEAGGESKSGSEALVCPSQSILRTQRLQAAAVRIEIVSNQHARHAADPIHHLPHLPLPLGEKGCLRFQH